MRTLGNYLTRGNLQATGFISLLAALVLLLPIALYPLIYPLCGAPLALVTMRRGPFAGLQVLLGSCAFTGIFYWLLGIGLDPIIMIITTIWLPVLGCAIVLRLTNAQGWMMLAAAVIGCAVLTGLWFYMNDPAEWWRNELGPVLQDVFTVMAQEQPQAVLETMLPLMNALLISGMMVNLITTTLLARWWQSNLFNPGGFGTEFAAIMLPRALLLLMAAIVVSLFLLGLEEHLLLRDILIVLIIPYIFQGVAVAHRTVRSKKLSVYWLVCMYVLMLNLPMLLLIACLGIMDSLFNKRNAHP